MIPIENLTEIINRELNSVISENNGVFDIVPDGDDYHFATREYNKITRYINGVAQITDSSLTIINGLYVAQQVLTVEVLVRIDPNKPKQESFEPIRAAISAFTQTARVSSSTDNEGNVYSISYYGTQPTPGEIMQRPQVGESITYRFSVFFSFIQNGINSLNVEMTFEGERVPFTELLPSISPVMESGSFSNSGGASMSYPTTDALQLTLTVPALTNNILTEEFLQFILTKQRKIYAVTISCAGIVSSYSMIFGQSNFTVRGADGIGQSITLVEALEAQDEQV